MSVDATWIEFLGYLASVIVLISLTMSSLIKLRWISLVGSSLFSTYGWLIHSMPVGLLNLGIALINAFYLIRYQLNKEKFALVDAELHSPLMKYFLEENRHDIERFVAVDTLMNANIGFYMLRDNNLAGIMIGNQEGDALTLKLDYVIPQFRDFKLGNYFFVKHPELLKAKGINKVVAYAGDKNYHKYLKRMGFSRIDPKKNEYVKILNKQSNSAS